MDNLVRYYKEFSPEILLKIYKFYKKEVNDTTNRSNAHVLNYTKRLEAVQLVLDELKISYNKQ